MATDRPNGPDLDEPNPSAAYERRGMLIGICVAVVVGSILWLTDAVRPLGASVLGILLGIAVAMTYQRVLPRLDKNK
ncbi:MAG: hypothetical protein GEU28_01695 [Dehalococcoidia bacterium]|nr:hypothetical protein [Dehalococcoidia bacterium]